AIKAIAVGEKVIIEPLFLFALTI
ncbi:MAG: hypothetical protein RLZZ69_844, partial [Cyanobacteriota bacterium]